MHKKLEPAGKRRNEMRWQQGQMIFEEIAPTLPSPSYVAVLAYCWFRARNRDCIFSESSEQISQATKVSVRHVKRILGDLESAGVIVLTEASRGRGSVCRRRITGNTYSIKGDTTSPQSHEERVTSCHPSPQKRVTPCP